MRYILQRKRLRLRVSAEQHPLDARDRPLTCANCQTELPVAANFCFHCGSPVAKIPPGARVLAIANQKGRVGKTTTAINLAACLAEARYKTLLVDLGPDCEATTGLGIDAQRVGQSIYEVLVNDGVSMRDVIRRDIRPNLALLPAKVELHAADIELIYLE